MTKKCDRCSTSQQHRIAQENPWWIHVDVWQNQYNIVKLKKKKNCIGKVNSQFLFYQIGRDKDIL